MEIAAIVQARLGSNRFPGKVLADVCGHPAIEIQLNRLRHCSSFNEIVVATTKLPKDDALFRFVKGMGIRCFRGSEHDVLDRFYQVAKIMSAVHICRLTADCPLIDPKQVDRMADFFMKHSSEYELVHMGMTFPEGLANCEFFSFETLEIAWREASCMVDREHVTQFLHRHPDRFLRYTYQYKRDLSNYRVGLDRPEDLRAIELIVAELGYRPDLGIEEIIAFLESHPEIQDINKHISRNEGLEISIKKEEELKRQENG